MLKLYGLTRTGKIKQWQITPNENGEGTYTTRHGDLGGKLQESTKTVKGKNIGRSNETTPFEQAVKEANSKYQKKVDEGYVEDVDNVSIPKLPMLAQPYTKRKHYIDWDSAFVQPKLDGVRCRATRNGDVIEYWSRKNKPFTTLDHLTPTLLNMLDDGESFDGELYLHGLELRHIISLVKKQRFIHTDDISYITTDLDYWVYDMPDTDTPFYKRYLDYSSRIYDNVYVKAVKTTPVKHEDDMKRLFGKYIEQGFEGAIIRNGKGLYGWGFRSNDLQKYKEFFDDEFEIVGAVKSEEGLEKDCVIWVCKTHNTDLEFNVRPRGSREEKREMYLNRDEYIGQQLTVRYQTLLTDSEIPQFGVGVAVRNYE